MQRLASHFASALARRLLRSLPGLYRALDCTQSPISNELLAARRHFSELCPYLCLSFVISNHAIFEAMEGEKVIHVIDLTSSEPAQWILLMQLFASRPEGPPHLKITCVHEQKEMTAAMAARLKDEAELLKIPFQFNGVVSKLEDLDVVKLNVKSGEAVAISSALKLHCLLATAGEDAKDARKRSTDSVSLRLSSHEDHPPARIDSFLALIWGVSPKIFVVTEQEANHNGQVLNERFMEALFYYAAMFDCLDSTLPRDSAERLRIERAVFGEEIKSIIACEGLERKERHEKLEMWSKRFEAAGFGKVALSYMGLLQARTLLSKRFRCEGYKVNERNGSFTLCWQDRALFSVSAWSCKRF